MVKKFIGYDQIYNVESQSQKFDMIMKYQNYINELTNGFLGTKVEVDRIRDEDQRLELSIHGEEENFVYNLLKAEISSSRDFYDINVGDILKGRMVDVGEVGFGIFVDCAIINPEIDVLLPLHILRDQLANTKKVSVRKIVGAYNFIDKFTLFIKISNISPDKKQIEGKIAQKSIDIFKKIVSENIEGLFISGSTKGQFKKALIGKGHLRDIISIERFGFLEHLVLLKGDTEAPGIISEIGRNLEGCKFSALRAHRIRKLLK
ncbi:MAG: DUF2110 family protein [Candidatus Lokiarchaeota archaeon]|nr:DUF2110 family protein [Candidatus Lokiarchaeota archaeon]MBD3199323.1 DUF2110 family protein [Candidatus Lokiarchaeota archaeon]